MFGYFWRRSNVWKTFTLHTKRETYSTIFAYCTLGCRRWCSALCLADGEMAWDMTNEVVCASWWRVFAWKLSKNIFIHARTIVAPHRHRRYEWKTKIMLQMRFSSTHTHTHARSIDANNSNNNCAVFFANKLIHNNMGAIAFAINGVASAFSGSAKCKAIRIKKFATVICRSTIKIGYILCWIGRFSKCANRSKITHICAMKMIIVSAYYFRLNVISRQQSCIVLCRHTNF